MITDTDITKLKKTFATKEDLKKFATKKDLSDMRKDFKKVFATKEDLAGVRDELKEDIADIHVELGELHDKFDNLAGKFDSFEVKLDKIVGGLEDERLENAAGAVHLARHDRQIEALALATNVAIPD